jgi:hypothetical protein
MGIIRLHLMRFTEVKTRGPQRENSGDFRGLRATERYFL